MTTTTKQSERGKVPKLRFSGFVGEWEKRVLGDYLKEYTKKVPAPTTLPIYSSTRTGLMPQAKYYNNRELQNNGLYGVVPQGYFVYRHMSDDLTFKFNVNEYKENIAVSKEYPVFRTNNLNSYFLLISLNEGKAFKRFAIQQKKGGTRTRLYFNVLKKLKINLPTLPEQQTIANFLESVDKWIENLRSQKKSLEAYKKGMMQKVFPAEGEKVPEVRFEGFSGEWEEKRLGEVCDLIKDGTHGTHPNTIGGGYRLLSAKNIKNGKVRIDEFDREISVGEYEKIHSSYELHSKDILLSIVGTIGNVALFDGRKNVAFQRSVAFFRMQRDLPDYVYYIFVSNYFQNELKRRQVVSAQPGIYLGDLAKIPIPLPTLPEQQKVANFLTSIDRLIEAKQEQVSKAEEWKKGLMQKLFI